MPVPGKLELTIKINELPDAREVDNGWKAFDLECNGQLVSIVIRPKMWNKIYQANQDWPMWVASIGGTMGRRTQKGFTLEQPNVQVFERKPKEAKPEAEA